MGLSIWYLVVWAIFMGTFIIPLWRIVAKAGYSGTWSLMLFVPMVNMVMIWVFAFSKWPVETDAGSDV